MVMVTEVMKGPVMETSWVVPTHLKNIGQIGSSPSIFFENKKSFKTLDSFAMIRSRDFHITDFFWCQGLIFRIGDMTKSPIFPQHEEGPTTETCLHSR